MTGEFDPPLADGSVSGESSLRLLLSHNRNRELLADWLAPSYQISTGDGPDFDGTDLCLVDDEGFLTARESIQDWKEAEHPRFAPVVLITEQPLSEDLEPEAWADIDGLYVVDEVVSMPTEKSVLGRRLENLLERRFLSDRLARQYERSEQRFASLFHAMPDAAVVLDEDATMDYVNDAFCATVGLEREAILGESLESLSTFDAATIGQLQDAAARAMAGETVDDLSIVFGTEDDDVRHAELSVRDTTVADKRGAVLVFHDVTERVEREYELEESERRFRSLFQSSKDALLLADDDGRYVQANEAATNLFGLDRDELRGRSVEEFTPAGYDFEAVWETFLDQGSMQGEFELVRPDGEHRITEFVATTNVRPGEHLSSLRDVTERREMQRELAQSEQRFREIANHVREVIWMVTPDASELLYMSPSVEDLIGQTPDEIRDDPASAFAERMPEDDRTQFEEWLSTTLADIAAGGENGPYHTEFRLSSPDGTRWIELDAYPVCDEAGAVERVVGMLDDITETNERERELERQNEQLEEFANIVSHDLRNPIQIIQSRAEMLRERDRESVDSESISAIRNAAGRMDELIEDLLSLSRQGEALDDIQVFDLSSVVEDAWNLVETGEATLQTDIHATVEADSNRLQQLFENLFRNAIEHAGPAVTVSVGTRLQGFYVADDGPGIPEEHRESAFESGFSTNEGGTGYGLHIVADIVEAHGWSIEVTESDAGGTRFDITGVEFV
ncbi:PAS domain-containing sensor histidine kinase [Salinibaculum salinum]|uniref:PAS domain-containing protein n=1 Tax=Salinibaculum salinum TaxID=3131996 RepID=UPI0030EDEA20